MRSFAAIKESWPCYLAASLIILTITYLHFTLTVESYSANLELLTSFLAPKPYGQRVLIPFLVSLCPNFVGINYYYAIIETIFFALTYQTLFLLSHLYFDKRVSHLISLLFLCLLPLMYVVNFYFNSVHLKAPFYYPYDVPAMFFVFLNLYLAIQKRWGLFYVTLVLATCNRESSIINVFMPFALYFGTETNCKRHTVMSLFLYVITRLCIDFFLSAKVGGPIMMIVHEGGGSQLARNIALFFHRGVMFQILAELLFLPVFFVLFAQYITRELYRLHLIAIVYGIGLFYISFIVEARIWQEVNALLYFPVAVGCVNWLQHKKQVDVDSLGNVEIIERYAGLFLMLFALMSFPIALLFIT